MSKLGSVFIHRDYYVMEFARVRWETMNSSVNTTDFSANRANINGGKLSISR